MICAICFSLVGRSWRSSAIGRWLCRCRWHATGRRRARPGAFDGVHAGLGRSAGPEADARRTSVPAHPAHVSRTGRKDYRHVAGDRQLRVAAHVGASRSPQGQGLQAFTFFYFVTFVHVFSALTYRWMKLSRFYKLTRLSRLPLLRQSLRRFSRRKIKKKGKNKE